MQKLVHNLLTWLKSWTEAMLGWEVSQSEQEVLDLLSPSTLYYIGLHWSTMLRVQFYTQQTKLQYSQ